MEEISGTITPSQLNALDGLCRGFEAALDQGKQPKIEDYLDASLGVPISRVFVELLDSELAHRLFVDEKPSASEYFGRFPNFTEEINECFDGLRRRQQASWIASVRGPRDTVAATVDDTVISRESRSARDEPTIGKIDRFELKDALGGGAFGIVFRAHDPKLHRSVAIKVPRLAVYDDEHARRFRMEARAAAQLTHPNIVAVYETELDRDKPYIVTKFVDGPTLSQCIKSGELPDLRRRVEWISAIAAALHYSHQNGVVHRDIKPANILIDASLTPLIADFGLARLVNVPRNASHSVMGGIVGTPAYMSPEQAVGGAADAKSDQYSLGVVMFEVLTGERPFNGDNSSRVMQDVRTKKTPSLRSFRSEIPRDLDAICHRAMSKATQDRYPDLEEMAADLRCWLDGHPVKARPVGGLESLRSWAKRQPVLACISGLAITLLVCCCVFATMSALFLAGARDVEAARARENATAAAKERKLTTQWQAAAIAEKESTKIAQLREDTANELLQEVAAKNQKLRQEIERRKAAEEKTRIAGEETRGALESASIAEKEAQQTRKQLDARRYVDHIQLAYRNWYLGNFADVRQHLDACEKDAQSWEWTYLARQLETKRYYPSKVEGFFRQLFWPQGELTPRELQAYRIGLGDLSKRLIERRATIVEVSRDGRRLLALAVPSKKFREKVVARYGSRQLEVIDVLGGRVEHKFWGSSPKLSPSGRYLAALRIVLKETPPELAETKLPSAFATVSVWDLSLPNPLPTDLGSHWLGVVDSNKPKLKLDSDGVWARFAFSRDDQELACYSSQGSRLVVWNVSTGEPKYGRLLDAPRLLAFSEDDKKLLSVRSDATEIMVAYSGKTVEKVAFTEPIPADARCCFSHDKRFVSVSVSVSVFVKGNQSRLRENISVMEIATGEVVAVRLQSQTRKRSNVFASDELIVAPDASWLAVRKRDGGVDVFRKSTGKRVLTGPSLIRDVRVFGDGLSSAMLVQGARYLTLDGNRLAVNVQALCTSPKGYWIAAVTGDRTVSVWNVGRPRPLATKELPFVVTCLAFANEGQLVAGDQQGRIHWLSRGDLRVQKIVPSAHGAALTTIAVSRAEHLVATGGRDGMLRVWDEISGKSTVVDGLMHFGQVHNVVFNPVTGELAAAGNEGAVRVWDLETKNLRLYLPSRSHEVHGLAYSNDGKRLFMADDGGVSIWDATSGVRVLEFELASPPTCLDLSADGRVLAVADEAGNIHLWETP